MKAPFCCYAIYDYNDCSKEWNLVAIVREGHEHGTAIKEITKQVLNVGNPHKMSRCFNHDTGDSIAETIN